VNEHSITYEHIFLSKRPEKGFSTATPVYNTYFRIARHSGAIAILPVVNAQAGIQQAELRPVVLPLVPDCSLPFPAARLFPKV
jgi:hypothetical protein